MMQNQVENKVSLVHGEDDMGLVLSADAKPRLKWTPELHQRFVDAVSKLGGIQKATPKTVMKVMGVPKLTLFHLKSHLQKYRLKNQQSGTCSDNKEDCAVAALGDTEIRGVHVHGENFEKNHIQINESLQIAKALQRQLEVQQSLHEQIEVQRRLQLRIEAQGKYLQSVLKKAQEMLAGCNISSLGLEAAKEELSELVSLANANSPSGPSSSLSELTEMSDLQMQKQGTRPAGNCFLPHQPQLTDSSMDSCLTSSESSERKDEKLQSSHVNSAYDAERSGACALKPIEINSNNNNLSKIHLSNRPAGGKRTRRSDSSDDTGTEKQISEPLPYQENFDNHLKRFRLSGDIDLNSQYQSEMDVGGQKLDLNCWI